MGNGKQESAITFAEVSRPYSHLPSEPQTEHKSPSPHGSQPSAPHSRDKSAQASYAYSSFRYDAPVLPRTAGIPGSASASLSQSPPRYPKYETLKPPPSQKS